MWGKMKQSVVFNIGIALLAIFVVSGTYRMVEQAFSAQEGAKEEVGKIEELKQKKSVLEASLEELKTKDAVTREAKERLNYKLPGEEVVVVVPEKKAAEVSSSSTPTFWQKIINLFK